MNGIGPKGGRRKAAVAAKDPAELVRVCARLAEDKKAEEIVVLDLRGLMYVTDFFVIASGGNPRQLHAIQSRSTRRCRSAACGRSARKAAARTVGC